MAAQVLDFGRLKFIAPLADLSPPQWSIVRSALSLASQNCQEAAETIIEGAGLLIWPERKRRTTRSWTSDEMIFVLANYSKMDSYRLGRSIGRTSTAVEFFLAQRGLKAMRIKVEVKRGRRTDAPHKPMRSIDPDQAHLAAIFRARPMGLGR